MMSGKESVQVAVLEQPSHAVDYYYLEAMRYLTCKASQHSDESDNDDDYCNDCDCSRCRAQRKADGVGGDDDGGDHILDDSSTGRERSWSHSMAKDRESGTLPELPVIDGKFVGGRLRNRRYSDGMLLKKTLKEADGHVHWADECKKELTRFRPRKKYTRSPSVSQMPVKSILKNSSEESLVLQNGFHSDSSTDD